MAPLADKDTIMARLAKLSDLQLILLSTAAARDGSLLPLADSIASTEPARIVKAVQSLLTNGFVAEVDVSNHRAIWREQDDRRIGLALTDAGRAVVDGAEPAAPSASSPPKPVVAPKRPTKTAEVLTLLRRDEGATLAELIATTGWLPHTTRAALTGLRKKGHAVERGKRGKETCYYVRAA